jgi:hypothetical protein
VEFCHVPTRLRYFATGRRLGLGIARLRWRRIELKCLASRHSPEGARKLRLANCPTSFGYRREVMSGQGPGARCSSRRWRGLRHRLTVTNEPCPARRTPRNVATLVQRTSLARPSLGQSRSPASGALYPMAQSNAFLRSSTATQRRRVPNAICLANCLDRPAERVVARLPRVERSGP